MSENQKQVLQMVSDGKISVDEAERLLKLIGEDNIKTEEPAVPPVAPPPPRQFNQAENPQTDEKTPPVIEAQPTDTNKGGNSRYTGFARVHASSAIDVKITHDAQFSVNATPDDLRDLIIEQDGTTLRIRRPGFWGMWMGWGIRPRVRITMPALEEFRLSGASYGAVKDFTDGKELKLVVNGASHVKVNNLAVETLRAAVDGASGLAGDIKVTGDMRLTSSGASRFELQGSAQSARIDLTGASSLKLGDFKVNKADVDFSGAVNGSLQVDGHLDARISGASNLYLKGNTAMGNIETSGASHIHRA
ncbi:MAG: DUF2807 domain-containing protein [Dehalococcoidales bacterium]|nr:DUF2807 domain-containing protein [Dehalococcoidales bacterium]